MNDDLDTTIDSWTMKLRAMYPQAVAILLRGSHVRSDAGPNSDVDFDVLLDGECFEAYPMFLERGASGRIRHVSVAVQDLASWLGEEGEPSDWAFGFGTRMAVKLLWATDEATMNLLAGPWREHPAAEPELEDFVEGYGKVLNAVWRGDDLGARQAAQSMAGLAPSLLRLVNEDAWPGTRREALDAALEFPVAPAGYRGAMLRCLGFSGEASNLSDLMHDARLLAEGVIRVLRERGQLDDAYPEGEPFGLLANGTIEAYLEQMRSG